MVETVEKMKDLSALRILVAEWTHKAQNNSYTDDERNVYYNCAEELHKLIHQLEEGGS